MTGPMPFTQLDDRAGGCCPWSLAGPYVLLGALALFTAGDQARRRAGPWPSTWPCAAWPAAWMLWMFTLHPAWRVRPRVMAVFFTVFIVIMAVLVIRDPWFGFLTPAGYLYAFAVLPWPWRLPGVAAVAVVAATAQTAGVDRASPFGILVYAAVLSVNVVPLCALAWMDWSNDTHAEQREQALAEVSEANQRLEATLAENAGLHEQLLTQAREAGILDERQRMAREIHDTLAQGLTGIITQLQAAEQASGDPAGLAPARGRRDQAGPGEPVRGPAVGGRAAPRAAGAGPAQRRAGRRGRALVGAARDRGPGHDHRHGPADAAGGRVRAAARGAGGAGQRGQARPGDPGRADPVLHGRRGRPGRARRRPGLRPGRQPEAPPAFGLAAMRQRIEGLSGTLQVESEPGGGTAISACVPAPRRIRPARDGSRPAACPRAAAPPAPAKATA